ncbi:6-phosphogluconolactonase [Baumannia cicadellinicola str. Hc (Homalodisca coagulata)]|uniref:6-phosphogluconolactonase n=2 Tax=Candidatus Palibaumannia cicadellinicola TaxID=186490 RepID=Q1LTM0_BAUCH|nr:6-phosphogluconolactonase [Baumannia cicadellinicola str. Hc (Homalodisca coagulata)]
MAIHPAKTHLYLGIRPICSIVSYSIDINSGLLYEVDQTSLPNTPTHLSTDLFGKNLYCASYNGSCLSVHKINEQGIVGTLLQIIDGLTNCHSSNVDTNNLLVWVPCLKEDRISIFRRAELGTLIPYKPNAIHSITGAGPRHMVFHKSGRYAYVINELNSTISICTTNHMTGDVPNIVQNIDIMPSHLANARWAADIHITPNSQWLYCSERSASIIAYFRILEHGSLLQFMGYQETEIQPRGFNIDATGRYLIVSGQKSNYITVYNINQKNGMLKPLARYEVGHGPMYVAIIDL